MARSRFLIGRPADSSTRLSSEAARRAAASPDSNLVRIAVDGAAEEVGIEPLVYWVIAVDLRQRDVDVELQWGLPIGPVPPELLAYERQQRPRGAAEDHAARRVEQGEANFDHVVRVAEKGSRSVVAAGSDLDRAEVFQRFPRLGERAGGEVDRPDAHE